MGERDGTVRSAGIAWWLLVGLTFVILGESIRVAFPLLYDVREDAGARIAVVWALGAFAAVPALTPVLRRLTGPGRALRYAVTALAAARIGMQLVPVIPPWLAAFAVASGLIALILELHTSRARGDGAGAAVTIVLALAVDTAIRGAYETWDPVWRLGPAPTTLAAVLVGVLLATTLGTRREPQETDAEPTLPWSLTLIGPFLLLQTLFLQNVAFVASEGGQPMVAAVLFVLAGDVVALAVVTGLVRHPERSPGAGVRATVGIVFAGAVAALALTDRTELLGPAQVLAAVLLLWAIDVPHGADARASTERTSLAVALGMAVFVGGAFAYQIDIDVPLPVPRAAFPILAAALLGAAAIPSRLERHRFAVPRWLWVGPAALTAAVGTGLAIGNHSPNPVIVVDEVRVMSWNIHTAVNEDGNVDLAAIADEIEREGPQVVLLQEVGRGWPIAGQADQAEWLARRLDMDLAWASAADDQFGNAILTSLWPLQAEVLRLPYGEGPQHRSALGVWIREIGDREVRFVDTHLQNGDDASTREDQIVALLDAWGTDGPTVIAGDLNMEPTEDNAALFTDAGLVSAQDAVGDPGASTARDPEFPGNRVDWIWASPDLVLSDFAIVQTRASDHLPLMVTVSLADG